MSLDALITLIVLVGALIGLASQRLRADVIALLVMVTLILTGVVGAEEAFSAFGQPVIIIIGAIYVIGSALYETGVATLIANQLLRLRQRGELVLLVVIMVTGGLLSAILSSLLVTAVLLPAVLRLARRTRISPSQFLIPLSTAANVGNQLTLIAAVSNLVIHDLLVSSGAGSLGLFGLLPYGASSLAVTIAWFALAGRHLLPRAMPETKERPTLTEVEEAYQLQEQLYRVRVRAGSDLIGLRLDESGLRGEFDLNVVAIQPYNDSLRPARPDWILEQDDLLVVEGERGDIHQAATMHQLEPKGTLPLEQFETLEETSLRLAEVMVPYRSPLVGQTIRDNRFRDRHGLNVLAVHREGRAISSDLQRLPLAAGDTLLVQGPLQRLRQVGDDLDLVLVTHLGPQRGDLITSKASVTIGILLLMLVAIVSGWLSLATAGLAAVVALILTGCISPRAAYQSVNAELLILVGGMLPLATALENTGLAGSLADGLAALDLSPFLLLLLLYILGAVLTQVVSNVVTGVLLMPVALGLTSAAGISPVPFAIALMVAVNAAYVSPLTHGSNLMIREPGRYTLPDYVVNNGAVFVLQSVVVLGLLYITYFV